MSLSRLVFAPYDPRRDDEVEMLFREYSHKDFQLQAMGISKDSMAEFLKTTLLEAESQNIILRDDGRLVGLISLQFLPWMSDHFGLRMYAVRHLLARSDSPLVHTRLLRVVIEELPDVDFLDCRVAVDDVGSGYSGLRVISETRPDFIKLDMHITRNVRDDDVARELVSTIQRFSDRANIPLIVEGVETRADTDQLQRLGVRYVQGFLLAHPESGFPPVDFSLFQ